MTEEHKTDALVTETAPKPAPKPAEPKPEPEAKKPAEPKVEAPVKAEVAASPVAPGEPSGQRVEAPAQEAPRPRRSRAKARAEGEGAPASEPADQPAEAPKPRRTRKPRAKAAAVEPAAASEQAPESPEIIQARALAQISQASVARRQRRMEERAAKAIEGPDAPVEAAPAPDADAPAIPVVDPALRPHRRGRKPKAYVEAERAAAAAMEAAQRAVLEQARSEQPQPDDAASAPAADVRPGRSRRAAAKAKQAEAAAVEAPSAQPAQVEGGEAPEAPARAQDDAPAKDADKPREDKKPDAREGSSRRSHSARQRDRQHGDERADKREDRARNRRENRKNRKERFNAPTEPSISRDDLAALKVAELREKAKELEIDYSGKKKAELVEEIYTTAARAEGFRDIEGILDIAHEGHGYIRAKGYMPSRDDAFVPANMIRSAGLRPGDIVAGTLRPSRANDKFPGLAKITSINGQDPEAMRRRPKFSDLTPIYPNEPLKMEHGRDSITGRAIDIVSPIGKGQRGLIVSPPKAGKTTVLKKICQSIATNNPEVHLICLLVDERPEEVTDMQRSIKGDVVASTFDMPADNHTRVSELVIERAKRIVEMGGDVVVVLDSITRLARAYNLAAPASGRILSGGVDSAALYPPKRFLGAARNIENGGSLTILASALVDTGSKMDEVIFEEFKGTGNMELKLSRDLADRRIFPAIDPIQSGTRNEDLLVDKSIQPFVWGIRRILANMANTERAAASFIKGLKGTNSNEEFLIRSAKKAADHSDAL